MLSFLKRLFSKTEKERTEGRKNGEIVSESIPPEMNYLVIGLGNIGSEYASTRHNIGFMTLDAWAQASGVLFSTDRYGDIAQISFRGRKFHLLKPSTYMNLSGKAVRYWMNRLSIPLERTIIICDDINLPFGTVRMRKKGSDGGHNGLTSIQECLGTQDYVRIRMGVGNNFHPGEQIEYVLGNFSKEEKEAVEQLAYWVIEGVKAFALVGADKAMNQVNAKPPKRNTQNGGDNVKNDDKSLIFSPK